MSTLSCTCCAHVCSVTSSSPSSFLYSLPPASNVFRSITALFRLFSAQRVHRWLLRLVLLLPGVDAGFAKVIRQYLNGTLSYRPHSSVASFVGLQEPTRILGSTPRSSPLASIPGLAAAPTWSHLVKWGSCTPDLGLSPYVSDSNSGRPSRHRQLLENLVASDTLLLPPLPIQFEYPQLRINDVSLSPSQVVPSYNGFPRNKVATVPPNYRTELISQQPNSPRELEDQPYFAPILHHIKESYCINGLLGEGSFGRVLHATTSQGKAVAIKGVHKHFMYGSVGGRKCLLTEKEVMRRATLTDKRFLSNLLASWDDGEFVYFVMPLYPASLFDVAFDGNGLQPAQVKLYAAELVVALKQMLEVRAMHRDIKHENILVSRSGHLVLSDFGGSHVLEDSARRIENVRMSDYVGTPGYMAPELWLNRDKPPSYFFSADIWSMGVVFLELLTGKRCFEGFTEERIHRVINCYPMPCGTVADPVARDLVRKMLSRSPFARPNVREIMEHPYFEGIDWQKVENQEYEPLYKPKGPVIDHNKTEFFATLAEERAQHNYPEVVAFELAAEMEDLARGKSVFDFVCPPEHFPAYLFP